MGKKQDNRYGHGGFDYRLGDAAQSYGRIRRRRRMKKSVRRAAVLLVAVGLMLGGSWVAASLLQTYYNSGISHISATAELPVSLPEPVPAPQSEPAVSSEVTPPSPPSADNTAWNLASAVEGAGIQPLLAPDARMLALPENGRVDMAYFDTTVFVGDSITQGLQLFSAGIPNAHYCAYKGVSPRAIYSGEAVRRADGESEIPLDAVRDYQPDNVYILLGTNAMVSMDDESLLTYYSELVDAMKAGLHPEVNYYIQSITPTRPEAIARVDAARIRGVNNQLAKMAVEKGCYYIDLHEALAGGDGQMREDYAASDGYHMTPAGYAAWVEYLVTHTAYSRRHAHLYQEGTHYYSQLPPEAE